MSDLDNPCRKALEKDREHLAEFIKDCKEEIEQNFDFTLEKVVECIERERKKSLILLRRLERRADAALSHLIWMEERNRIWRNTTEKMYAARAKNLEKDEGGGEEGKLWFGFDAILKILMGVSGRSSPLSRNIQWEKASYSFLVPGVFERALNRESAGYLLSAPLDPSKISSKIEDVISLFPPCEEGFGEDVKDLWVELILPGIYGGTDPSWAETECLEGDFDINEDPVYIRFKDTLKEGRW